MVSNNSCRCTTFRIGSFLVFCTSILSQFFAVDKQSVLQPAAPSVSNGSRASRSEGNSSHQAYVVPPTTAPTTTTTTTTTTTSTTATTTRAALPLTTIVDVGTDSLYNFSMGNTLACAKHIREDDQTLIDIASAVADYHYHSLNATADKLTKAKEAWSMILEDCHGPIPPQAKLHEELKANFLDPIGWLKGLLKCGGLAEKKWGGLKNFNGGEWCRGKWHGPIKRKAIRSGNPEEFSRMFIQTARCMLHMEFPLLPQSIPLPRHQFTKSGATATSAATSTVSAADTVILVTLAATSTDVKSACGLLASAVAWGWDIAIGIGNIEGSPFGLPLKYKYAIETIQLFFQSSPELNPDKTVIVFADGHDMLANVEPGHVLEMFQKQPHDFVWSSEPFCFPMGLWPHNLGAPTYTCNVLFPSSSNETLHERRNSPQFVNTGGWIGLASTALQVLAELSHFILSIPTEDGLHQCHELGTDQLLGNAHLLRHYSSGRFGLDVDSNMFLSDSQGVYREGKIIVMEQKNKIMSNSRREGEDELRLPPQACFDVPGSGKGKCPAFLHFNGCGSDSVCPERIAVTNALRPTNFSGSTISNTNLASSGHQATVVDLTGLTVTKLPNIDICFPTN